MKGKKVGRNDSCPCGSQKKYKKCCLDKNLAMGIKNIRKFSKDAFPDLRKETEVQNQENAKKLEKIGYYLRHIHLVHKGKRLRSVYGTLYQRPPEETFHEFIIFLLKQNLGEQWRKEQMSRPEEERHFIIKCYTKYVEWMQKNKNDTEKFITGRYSGEPDGYTQWLICLAFDLYCLQHCKKLSNKLLNRLKNNGEEFQGARYEIAVASIFARAGFEIDFFDNKKLPSPQYKPCEFIASHQDFDVKIAVEAKSKRRKGVLNTKGKAEDKEHFKGNVHSLLKDATTKDTDGYPYLIFIDVNVPTTPYIEPLEKPWFEDIKRVIDQNKLQDKESKDNCIFFTNFSYHYQRDKKNVVSEYIAASSLKPQHLMSGKILQRIINILNNYKQVHDLDLITNNEQRK
jgi:SEC-C motif